MHGIFLADEATSEEHGPLAFVPVEFALALIVFGILLFAIWKFVAPRFEQTYAARTAAIEGGLEAAATKQAEVDAKLAELEAQLSSARDEAARIREDAKAQGEAIKADLKAQAEAESNRIVEAGRAAVEAERQAAVASLRHEVGSLATELAGKIVGEKLDDDKVAAGVVDRFLADLEEAAK